MRILAIRGCNLASLAGEFEIDLARPPFGGAGVFAIVGNTGAGKSTLLDALCAALFDRTPRLANHSRVVVGRGEDDPAALGAQDVRTLLRRGAAQGWAEVDFESGDARRYRARWSVRRARGHADGALQDQQVTLTAIDGAHERLGGTKTETLKAIAARLGLSFDQFRRSALLAQGDFAAFLRADGRDRSELLERMTGTAIYSRLSVAAHARAALAEQRTRAAHQAALAIPILDEVARARAQADLELADVARRAARARSDAAESAARWLDEAARRRAALADADATAADQREALARAEPARAELALRRRAERLRAPWHDAHQAALRLAEAWRDAAAAAVAVTAVAEDVRDIARRRAAAAALHEPLRAARIAAGLVERVGSATDEGAASARARAALSDAAWLAARPALAAEVASVGELEVRFTQHASLGDAIGALERALREHTATRERLLAARVELVAEHQAAAGKLADAQRRAEGFHRRRGVPLDAARRLEDEARARLTELDQLGAVAADARRVAGVRAELATQGRELAAAAAAAAAERAMHGGALQAAQAVRAERVRVADELRRAAGLEHARAELRPGEACPLCGATEHPWRGRGALDDVVRDAEARLAEAIAAVDAHGAALAGLAAREQQRDREREHLARREAAAAAAAAAASATWRERLAALGELLLESDPATPSAEALASQRSDDARRRLEEARAVRHQTEAAAKAVQEAQGEVQLGRASLDRIAERLADHERRAAELAAAIERQEGELAGRRERRAELVAELEAALASWRAAAGPVELPGPGGLASAAGCAAARGAVVELAAAWRARAARVAEAEAELAATLIAIERAARAGERALAEHTARAGAAAARRDALEVEAAAAAARLADAAAHIGLSPAVLEPLLADPPSRADALAEHLDALARAADGAYAVARERQRLVEAHAAERPEAAAELAAALAGAAQPGEAGYAAALAAELGRRAAAVAVADAEAARLAAALAADADARARRAVAAEAAARVEEEAEVDRVLGEVIGSHDGKLFRSFAQSLTLDGLLAVANSHLEELAPRYQLERVPQHDLELQVIDRDLGAEVRSVQSLSGGESFLVSLALALGLSSMSAHDVRVRTLLIDEGFGTLDPATLDSALSVLDALQATGRQVGVISHVPALVERVGAHVRVIQRGGGRSEVVVT